MAINDHPLFDKRQKKPKVHAVEDIQQDVVIQQIETYKIGKAEVRFIAPNITAIFLSVFEKELAKAKALYKKLINDKKSKRERFELTEIETVEFYDYLESIQLAIVALYSAIESLTNVLIPDDFEYEHLKPNGVKETWNKSAIERWKPTREKIKEILPKALAIKSPSTYKGWSKFLDFEDLRNDIIHIKDSSLKNKENDKKIIGKLIDETVFSKINSAYDLIKELSLAIPNHAEFYEYPILNNSEPLVPIKIKSWSDLDVVKVN
jgi:hypothetical protein